MDRSRRLSSMPPRNEPKILGEFLAGTWSKEAENLIQDQLLQIATLNDTRVQPMTLGQFTDWLQSAFSFFKEWVGVGVFGATYCLGVFLCLCFCADFVHGKLGTKQL